MSTVDKPASRHPLMRFKDPSRAVYVLLVVATLVSWWLGDSHGAAKVATVIVLYVAFTKVYLVGQWFMELHEAPVPLRLVFGGWCVLVSTGLVIVYLTT